MVIVAGAFGIVGVYLYIVSRFIRAAEVETSNAERNNQTAASRSQTQSVIASTPISAH